MRSLRSKFSLMIVVILVLTFAVSGFFLMRQNIIIFSEKLQQDALNFAEFSSPLLSASYESEYKTGSFVTFQQAVLQMHQRNTDISKTRIISKENGILYDSTVEKDKQYTGPSRTLSDNILRKRLVDIKPSFLLESGETVYFQKNDLGTYVAVNENGTPLGESIAAKRVKNLVYPLPDKPYSLSFDVTYENIDRYIFENILRMSLFVLGSILAGILVSLFFVGQIVRPVEKLRAGAERLATGDFDTRVDVKTKDEIGVLADTFNTMAADLKKSTEERVEKERLSHEIHLAAEIQNDFIPKHIPETKGLDIAASVVPATEVGGDCYDFIKQGENLLMFIGDVTGHGVPAGLVEAITNSLFFTFSYIHNNTKDSIADMNYIIHKKTRPNVFVTCIMALWDAEKQILTYTNAGHDQIIHYSVKEGKSKLLSKGSLALGMISDIKKIIREEEVILDTGDLLILYTDGIPEAWSPQKQQLGIQKFMQLVEQHAHLPSAQNIHDGLVQSVRMHMGEAKQEDDITLIVLRKM